MNRKVLLIEPNYQNKYPPIGLMKISTYHKQLGDDVTFYKGNMDEFVVAKIADKCIKRLNDIDSTINWGKYTSQIRLYLRTKSRRNYENIPGASSKYHILITSALDDYSDYFKKKKYIHEPEYDRVYVATLFTFYWDITIKTIEFAKGLVKDRKQLVVGGVMASLLTKEIEAETGVIPYPGLLDKPGILDKDNSLIIDDMSLDYSILDEIDYVYPTQSAYFTFMTKGCTRTCAFCSVPKLEPTYKPYIETKSKFIDIKNKFGEQKNLLLMDNNVLASPNFEEIISEIKDMGFVKGATYKEPNQLSLAIKNLTARMNDSGYIKRSVRLLNLLLPNIKGEIAQQYYDLLDKHSLLTMENATKENILLVYPLIADIYEKFRKKSSKFRYVDFNQGVDCRYIDDSKMELISQIPIRPLRIAFDYIGLKDKYIKSVELAAKYGITDLSNYILYNFTDKPEDLYNRLKINVELVEELSLHIYSFPMKYIPLYGEEAKNRNYLGTHWNRKFIRAIQSILNVTKGIVAPGRRFFEKAFGGNLDEYFELLYMPESYIIYRKHYEESGITEKWRKLFRSLKLAELEQAKRIIVENDFSFIENKTENKKIIKLLEHYRGNKAKPVSADNDHKATRKKAIRLINNDNLLNLTLTYDFDSDLNEFPSQTIN